MDHPFLFYTTVPVLLGGSPRDAGRLASLLYTRHGVTLHWFGQGWHPLTAIYASNHPIRLPLQEEQDTPWLMLLSDFAKEQCPGGGILCLIPGSAEAGAFLHRQREILEEQYVILPPVTEGENPLYGLVHGH